MRISRHSDEVLNWQRWFRRAIAQSAHQLCEAERWIATQSTRIFLDAKCTIPLPVELPAAEHRRIHRVCVATGAASGCYIATGRTGLAIEPSVTGDIKSFTVGRVREGDEWINIFDEEALMTVLTELDTVADFVDYLIAKNKIIATNFQGASCEEDMLGFYLWHGRKFPSFPERYVEGHMGED